MANGNEFSDHKFEKINYLYLASSKIRPCSLGPELVIDPQFQSVPGTVTIERAGRVLWTKAIATGEAEMCHSLANIEHHHFKFETHRRPGDVHVHYYGAHSLSFGEGIRLADGDVMSVEFAGFGRALRNPLSVASPNECPSSSLPSTTAPSSRPRVAFLGLGIMGSRMAQRLLTAGYPLTVYNRNAARCAPFTAAGAQAAPTPRAAAGRAEVILSMLADDNASRGLGSASRAPSRAPRREPS